MTNPHTFRKTVAIVGAAIAFAVAACALPEDPYQRWRSLEGTPYAPLRWMYERSHFDPTPVDVVIIGHSRFGKGVSSPRLAAALAAQGLPHEVENFGLPDTGRNVHYAILKQLLERKRPKLVIIGVTEKPSRFGHNAFKYVADGRDIANPGYLANVKYPGDLIYLPYRRLDHAADLALGELTGNRAGFDRRRYAGPLLETTGDFIASNGRFIDAHTPGALSALQDGARGYKAGNHPPILPRSLADVEFGDERIYVRRIVELARSNGAKVAFLFIPYYSGPVQVQEEDYYRHYGPLWKADFTVSRRDWYFDYAHLTTSGAQHVTDWLAGQVVRELRGPSTSPFAAN